MAVKLHVNGLLLDCEFRPGDKADDAGFISAAVLPDGSREALELWGFGDNLAAQELLRHWRSEEVSRVSLIVATRAKIQGSGSQTRAALSTGIEAYISEAGETISGREPQRPEAA